MRIINSDGSEAEMCGNGIRCLAKYVYDRGLTCADKITVETLAGTKTVRIQDRNDVARQVRVDMGAPELRRSAIPMTGADTAFVKEEKLTADGAQLIVTCLSMGNPHCVTFVADVASFPVGVVGPAVERHEAFPNRTNAEFVQVISAEEIRMRVWERGAGETLACGTGACAAAVASALNGRTGRRVVAHLPGGALTIEWAEEGRVYMTGPAEEVFEGELDISRFGEA
jgi:diaminopimelate epimerase